MHSFPFDILQCSDLRITTTILSVFSNSRSDTELKFDSREQIKQRWDSFVKGSTCYHSVNTKKFRLTGSYNVAWDRRKYCQMTLALLSFREWREGNNNQIRFDSKLKYQNILFLFPNVRLNYIPSKWKHILFSGNAYVHFIQPDT